MQPSGVDASAGEVLLHHQRYLEGDGVVKLPQIQTRQLFDLLQPVHQRVPVDEQLPSGLGDVQVVLKELVDGEQRLLDRKSTRLNSSHKTESRMPSSA